MNSIIIIIKFKLRLSIASVAWNRNDFIVILGYCSMFSGASIFSEVARLRMDIDNLPSNTENHKLVSI